MIAHGGCYCGAVRYEVEGEMNNATLCHCVDCRRISGAPLLGWFTVPNERLRVILGAPAWFRSSTAVMRACCAACGTPLLYRRDDEPGSVDITTCSLDEPALAPPKDHTFYASRLPWLDVGDALPKFPRTRKEGQNE